MGEIVAPEFQWSAHPLAATYELQVARDSSFSNLVGAISGLTAPNCQGIVLEPATAYYFRARGSNVCGAGPWSAPRAFSTAAAICRNTAYTGPPGIISPQGTSYTTSSITIEAAGAVAGVAIRNIDITHSYVGDLSAFLRSPSGTIIQLFDRPGVPGSFYGCSGANLMLSFAVDAPNTQEELESTCGNFPAISGLFQPIDSLPTLIGEPAEGNWKLTVIDHFDQDGGQLNGWELELCTTLPNTAELFPMQNEHQACVGSPYSMSLYIGGGFPGPVNLHVIGAPSGSNASFSNNPAAPGSLVTLTIDSLAQTGTYPFIITGTNGANFHFIQQELQVKAIPPAPALLAPYDESPVFDESPTFTWTPVPEADSFLIQIATDLEFQTIVRSVMVATPYYTLANPLNGDIYYWRVLSVNSCGSNESGKAFTFSLEGAPVGSREFSINGTWQVFPNPTGGQLHIRWEGVKEVTNARVDVFTAEGQLIMNREFNNAVSISLEERPAGIYIVVLRNKWGVEVRKVVVRKITK